MRSLPWLILAAVVGFLLWKLRQTARRVLGADGRTFALVTPASADRPSIWRTVPNDGRDYMPDLGYDLGTSGQPPIMRSFVA